jgi:enoyl-[acyl-carrier protein] reductase II
MSPELLSAEIAAVRALTGRPFGVNLITLNPHLHDLIEVCAHHRVSHVVLAGGLPARTLCAESKARVREFSVLPQRWDWHASWYEWAPMRL